MDRNTPDLLATVLTDPIVAGLISGVLVSLLVVIVQVWWRGTLVPWFEDRVYKGTRIEGLWNTTMLDDGGNDIGAEQATLRQRAAMISGTVNYPEGGRSHTYALKGEFRDRTLTVIMREVGEGYQDLGAIVLDFKPGGAHPVMDGLGVWTYEGRIVAIRYHWEKVHDGQGTRLGTQSDGG